MASLRDYLHDSDSVYCLFIRESRSGDTRHYKILVAFEGEVKDVTREVCIATQLGYDIVRDTCKLQSADISIVGRELSRALQMPVEAVRL